MLDLPDVRATAIAEYGDEVRVYTDRLSNALGLMWRREVITRYPAPEQANSQARFMYEWPKDKPAAIVLPSTFPKAKTGVVITEHDLRGKVATDMDDPVAAQKLLGHKDMSMTEDFIKARQTEVVKPHTRRKKE